MVLPSPSPSRVHAFATRAFAIVAVIPSVALIAFLVGSLLLSGGQVSESTRAKLATGMVVIMTGCSSAAVAPTGDALYRDGEDRYLSYATTMHSVIMAIHDGEWKVDQGSWGASPIPCRTEDGSDGYAFAGISYPGLALRLPAFEGPDWQPRSYFPEDGSPVYWNEDGTPIEPPPTSTDFPVAPYGGGS